MISYFGLATCFLLFFLYVFYAYRYFEELKRMDARWRELAAQVRRRMQAEDEVEKRLEKFDLREFINR